MGAAVLTQQVVNGYQRRLRLRGICHRRTTQKRGRSSLAWPDHFFPFFFVVAQKGSGELENRHILAIVNWSLIGVDRVQRHAA